MAKTEILRYTTPALTANAPTQEIQEPVPQNKRPWLKIAAPVVALTISAGGFMVTRTDNVNAFMGILKGEKPSTSQNSETLQSPPNLGKENRKRPGYYQMPPSTDGAYIFNGGTCPIQRHGSKELIQVLYTAAQKWKEETDGEIVIGDLNGGEPHKSHKWGIGVDLSATTGDGKGAAAMNGVRGKYSKDATIKLGKIFLDTDKVKNIWYMDRDVNAKLLEYAKANDKSLQSIRPLSGHDTHFHIDISDTYKQSPWAPNC